MHGGLRRDDDGVWRGDFDAMASPCQVLLCVDGRARAQSMFDEAVAEARRIERKYSRYRKGNIVHRINASAGGAVEVDDETAQLLDFAARCYAMSEGAFDITSGLLRRVWTFDGGDRVPGVEAVAALVERIGWHRVRWERPLIALAPAMEIDLGGIAKEYAVDRVVDALAGPAGGAVLVNFGGDLRAGGPRADGSPWRVAVETPTGRGVERVFDLSRGALATSGDARRFVEKDGVRYGHVLDPRTGWPVPDAPRSVTVLADSCVEAGLLATLALLQGRGAESFLDAQGTRYWCQRDDS